MTPALLFLLPISNLESKHTSYCAPSSSHLPGNVLRASHRHSAFGERFADLHLPHYKCGALKNKSSVPIGGVRPPDSQKSTTDQQFCCSFWDIHGVVHARMQCSWVSGVRVKDPLPLPLTLFPSPSPEASLMLFNSFLWMTSPQKPLYCLCK